MFTCLYKHILKSILKLFESFTLMSFSLITGSSWTINALICRTDPINEWYISEPLSTKEKGNLLPGKSYLDSFLAEIYWIFGWSLLTVRVFWQPAVWISAFTLRKKATIHQVTTMLATSKNVLFPGHNHLLTTHTDGARAIKFRVISTSV